MAEKAYVMALDQGTTSSRAIIFNRQGESLAVGQKEFAQIYPRPGWVEHDPMQILGTQLEAAAEAIERAQIRPQEIAAIGITNQRETVVAWDRDTGRPVHNAIVWQCRRTAELCESIKRTDLARYIKDNTGLVIDAYFSGTKMKWILDNVEQARELADKGRLLFGTVDTWLVWNLTGGKVFATDYSNASRTMLYNIRQLSWDGHILEHIGIPAAALAEPRPSSCEYGLVLREFFGAEIPILGVAGDQQAALFGQTCFEKGMAKNTYGTGCFILMNTGETPVQSNNNLISTVAWGLDGKVEYALEGSVFNAGSSVQWLRDGLRLIDSSAQSEFEAQKVKDTGGVYCVPAFTGLGAPYWDMYARGAIVGLTRGTTREHLIRAVLESIAYQSRDIFEAMESDSGIRLRELRVDGGASANRFLMQFQADILNVRVIRPSNIETTALGAAFFAGLRCGFWKDKDEIRAIWRASGEFSPEMDEREREVRYARWKKAVARAAGWEKDVDDG